MRVARIKLQNFRCFVNEDIALSNYCALIGENNAGKSTILRALNIFFSSGQRSSPLTESDFRDKEKELRIEISFDGLSQKAAEEFSHYHRHGNLVFFIKAKLGDGKVESSVHGQRLGIPEFGEFHVAGTATDKKNVYAKLREKFPLPDIPKRSAVELFQSALSSYESENQQDCKLLPSEDLAFGNAGVTGRLQRYVEWVYVPAVKDAADEGQESRTNAFGLLINRIVRAEVQVDEKIEAIRQQAKSEIESLSDDYKKKLLHLQNEIDQEFRRITSADAHILLKWAEMDEKNIVLNMPTIQSKISDETFTGDVSEFGHGLQRNYLMALIQLNAKLGISEQPSIILAIEEPELYQHPPQARYLHKILRSMGQQDQVLITTHSPYFVSARTFEDARIVRKKRQGYSAVFRWSSDEHRRLIAQAFGEVPIGELAAEASLEHFIQPELNEAFFCKRLVLVEGLEDKAILHTVLEKSDLLADFNRMGGLIVGAGGKGNLINMVALARGFETPYFVVFDADTGCGNQDVEQNRELNKKILKVMGAFEDGREWPNEDLFLSSSIIWKTDIQGAIEREYGSWKDDVKAECESYGWSYKRLKKNPAVLSSTLEKVLKKTEIACLVETQNRLMAFAG